MMWTRALNRAGLRGRDDSRHFRTDHLKAELGSRTARGGVATLTSQGFKFFISMAATVVLARLLTPQDYGLVGMVAVVTGFVSIFKDMGLAIATIQKEEINGKQISTLFWINVTLSILVMLVTTAIAPALAWFYGEPRLTLITIGFAGALLFGGLTVQHEALLRRQMKFTALAVLEIGSLIAGIVAAVVFAWHGARYWALVINQLVQAITYAAAVWIVCGWVPGWPVRTAGVRSMFAFGGNLTGFHVINYFARNLDNMLIGKFWGSWQLGIYAKAYQLLLLPIDQINYPIAAVAIPALSRLNDSPERYRKAYLRMIEKIAILTMPGMAFMIMTSDWIVAIVLGPQWSQAARVFALLGIAGLVQPVANTTGWLFMSQNRAHHMFQWGIIGGMLAILSIIAGLHWGSIGVAASYSLTNVAVVIPLLFYFVGRAGPVHTTDFYRTMAAPASAALLTMLALLMFRHWVNSINPTAGLIIAFGLTFVTAFFVLVVLPSGRLLLRDGITMISLLTKSKPAISGS